MPSQAFNGQPGSYNTTPATRSNGEASGLEVDSKGNLLVNLNVPLSAFSPSGENDSILMAPFRRSDAVQNSINFSANTVQSLLTGVTGKSIYLTNITISSDGLAASSVKIQSTAGSPVVIVNNIYFPNVAFSITLNFASPKKVAVNDGINALCSSATPNVTVDVVGYQI